MYYVSQRILFLYHKKNQLLEVNQIQLKLVIISTLKKILKEALEFSANENKLLESTDSNNNKVEDRLVSSKESLEKESVTTPLSSMSSSTSPTKASPKFSFRNISLSSSNSNNNSNDRSPVNTFKGTGITSVMQTPNKNKSQYDRLITDPNHSQTHHNSNLSTSDSIKKEMKTISIIVIDEVR